MNNKKLGRGLEDISHLFISSSTSNEHESENFLSREEEPSLHEAIVIPVTGTGKKLRSVFLSNFSVELARRGLATAVIDFEPGLPAIHLLMGIECVDGFLSYSGAGKALLMDGPMGVKVGKIGVKMDDLNLLRNEESARIFSALMELEKRFDYIFLSIHEDVFSSYPLLAPSREIFMITNPDIKSQIYLYRVIKTLHTFNGNAEIGIFVCNSSDRSEAIRVFKKISAVAGRYLSRDLVFKGYITKGDSVEDSIQNRFPVVLSSRDVPTAENFHEISGKFVSETMGRLKNRGVRGERKSYFGTITGSIDF